MDDSLDENCYCGLKLLDVVNTFTLALYLEIRIAKNKSSRFDLPSHWWWFSSLSLYDDLLNLYRSQMKIILQYYVHKIK